MSAYPDLVRHDVLKLVPADGQVIGSIGCHRGATEAELIKRGRQVHGVDINADAIAVAATRLTSARIVSPDDWHPFADASLDGLILADVMEHIPQAWDALACFARMVRPGGWVVISVPHMRNFSVLWHLILRGDWPEHDLGVFDRTHTQVTTRRRLERWCRAAGLVPEQWQWQYDAWTYAQYRRLRIVNALTGRLLNSWFMLQTQVRCRVQ
ncbi:MAG: class I SAM-dependent methyltransferase [Phycisphaeraceae bacterium]